MEAKYKSRLVVRGDLEQGDPRSDSPTASIEAQNLVFSFAASRRLKLKALDVTNAYFQGEAIDRVLLLSQPKGGLPGLKPGDHMLARAPIYGPGGLMSLVITDASHVNEEEELLVNGSVSVEYHRSQGARMIFVATPSLWDKDKGSVHPIAWASNIVRRVCRSTIQAEAYTLQAGVEDGDVLRAAVADLFGALDLKRWEASAAKFMRQIWFTDCKSLEETLKNPKCSKHSDKRLSIEIASLRQDLWRKKGEEAGDPYEEDYRPSDEFLTDTVRWIDTDVMVADPLTKVMEPTKLVHVMETNELDVKQPIDSIVKKRAKQLQRRKGNPAEADPKEDG